MPDEPVRSPYSPPTARLGGGAKGGASTILLALVAPASFVALLAFFLGFRRVLLAIPVDVIDAFQKSSIGTLLALALLVLQPLACRIVARLLGASAPAAWWVFAAGILSSLLLFFPALLLFME